MWTGRPQRLPAFDYRGFRQYFLTFCTSGRRHYFEDAEVVSSTLAQILRVSRQQRFAVIAYCFMPDHLHLLVEGTAEDADVRSFIKLAKQCAGYQFKRERGQPLWQRYAYEHVVRSTEATIGIARYIVENPVRAGLVTSPGQYEFVGCPAYSWEALMDAVAVKPGRSAQHGPT
ncbi:MAG: transposase [Vicinamibacterales bacterium]